MRAGLLVTSTGQALWRRLFAGFEVVFSLFAICVYSSAFLPTLQPPLEEGVDFKDSDPTNQFCQFAILATVSVLMIIHRRRVLAMMGQMPGTLAILLLVTGSTLWSDDGALTLRRAVVFGVTTLFGVYLAVRFDFRRVSKLIAWVGLAAAASSIVVIVAVPMIGLEQVGQNAGLPRGVFATKNMLGFVMTLYSLFALWTALNDRRPLLYWVSWAGCILLAIVSRSATIAITLVVAYYSWALCAAFTRARHRRSLVLYMALMPLILAVCAVVLFPDAFVGMLGKDTTLSGRDILWAAVWDFIKERPLLGYGYGAFWRESGDEARLIWASLGWYPPHAHNAVLELLLQFGVLGLIAVTIYYGALWYRLARAAAAGDMPGTAPLMAMMVAFLVQGISEANMLHQGDIDWALTVFMAALFVRREAVSGATLEVPNSAQWAERAARVVP